MSERRLTRIGRLTAICMLVCAVVTIGLALAGVLQIRGPARRWLTSSQNDWNARGAAGQSIEVVLVRVTDADGALYDVLHQGEVFSRIFKMMDSRARGSGAWAYGHHRDVIHHMDMRDT